MNSPIMANLTAKQRQFVLNYLETFNAAKAASMCYSVKDAKSAKVIGHNLKKHPKVKEAISYYLRDADITARDLALTIKDALGATKAYKNIHEQWMPTDLPDHKVRLKALNIVAGFLYS